MQKKRLPIEQLREVAREGRRILVKRGVLAEESVVDRIVKENKIVLPGIPGYLPHRWTLQVSRQIMRDIVRLWVDENKGQRKQEKAEKFFAFLVNELTKIELKKQKEVDEMPKLLKEIKGNVVLSKVFSPLQTLETTQAITRFMVDSFAVSVVVKEHHTTTQFVEWFMRWTTELETYWAAKDKKDGQ